MTVTVMLLAGAGTVMAFFALIGYSLCAAAAHGDRIQQEDQRRRMAGHSR